jgi:5-methylcytosine-specific restriction enzyme B
VALFRDVQARFRTSADENSDEEPAPAEDDVGELFDDPNRRFWFVGALWSATEDQTDRFLSEGIWQNGYGDRYQDHVARMKPGDRIAIKASFVRKYGLPFDNQDKPVSCMRIKALGTITEGTEDGKTVKVDWTPLATPKDWYFYTYRITIAEADPSDEFARRLIQFAFGDRRQDYDYWLRVPYFARKYKAGIGTVTDIEREKEEAEADTEEARFEPYAVENILDDGSFQSEAELTDTLKRLGDKKNLILQGPRAPGRRGWLSAWPMC